jgi:DNA-binding transcriptional ArsR family regulator
METVNLETLQALGEVSPEVLRALAGVPVEALRALREVPVEALRGLQPEDRGEERKDPVFRPNAGADAAAEELKLLLNRVDEAMKRADVNVVMTFGKWRDPKDPQNRRWSWWNGWIDSGGGGISRLLSMPHYEVAEVFSVLGSEVRLAILRSLLDAPKSAAELVADLRLGTTGQAYHHLQELIRTGFVDAKDGSYYFSGTRGRAYFTALAVAADFVPTPSEDSGAGAA